MDYPVPPHWLRRNEGTRSPHRVLVLDTESRPELVGRDELHKLRWWHLRLRRRHVERPRDPVTIDLAGTELAELARLVDQQCIAKHSTWLYTHNLGFDLQLTRLPELLSELGWAIVDIGITGRSPWMRLSHGRRRLILADSTSWLPAPLADVGELVGVPKPVIDDWSTATDEQIAVRCLADVEILDRALCELMGWWDTADMGRWQWTGPGCGWAAFRHRFLNAKVLMDPNPERLGLERKAIYGGRREAYRLGVQPEGYYADMDFETAYPRIAAETELPRRPIARVPYMTTEAYGQLPTDWGILSECTVTTSVPSVPCRIDGSIFYPVGTFKTVLAGPDITGAIESGASLELGDTIIYQLERFLGDWGEWITGVIDGTGENVHPVVRMFNKHCSRTVIGRFAMHAQRVEDWGAAAWPYFHAEPGTDWDTGCEVVDLHACGRHLRIFRDSEPENVFPAVTAWVEATCRQALRRAMDACPPGSVMQCDTDGFMLDLTGELAAVGAGESAASPVELACLTGPRGGSPVPELIGGLAVKVKGLYRTAELLGPQHVQLGDSRRFTGVPRSFTTDGGLSYHGWTWPGYAWQLARSSPGVYRRPHVTIPLRGPYGSRWVMRDGSTMAPRVALKNGVNVIMPVRFAFTKNGASRLADIQPAALTKHR